MKLLLASNILPLCPQCGGKQANSVESMKTVSATNTNKSTASMHDSLLEHNLLRIFMPTSAATMEGSGHRLCGVGWRHLEGLGMWVTEQHAFCHVYQVVTGTRKPQANNN